MSEDKVEVTFTKDKAFSPDGVNVINGKKGKKATVSVSVAQRLVDGDVAKSDGMKVSAKPKRPIKPTPPKEEKTDEKK